MNVNEAMSRINDIESIQTLFNGITAGHGIHEDIEVCVYSLQRASEYLNEYKFILGQLDVIDLKNKGERKNG